MFDIQKFCAGKKSPSDNLKSPWRDGDKIYATNGVILFIGNAEKFPNALPSSFSTPNIASLNIDVIDNYMPVDVIELEKIITDNLPLKKEPIYAQKECPKCGGSGVINCECDCGNEHEKECSLCEGDGSVSSKKFIGERILAMPTIFKTVFLDMVYILLIRDAVKEFKGDWQVSVRGREDYVVFKNNDNVMIVVMPMKG